MRSAAWGLLLAGAVACVPAPPGRPDASTPEVDPASIAPSVVTSRVADAVAGAPYGDRLSAQNGVRPYTWAITTSAAWLTVDSATGALRGTPPFGSAGASVSFTATVNDASGRPGSATLSLTILACAPGATEACQEASAGACLAGVRTCLPNGNWSVCAPAGASASASGCGASCAACGPDADRCKAGAQCVCGASTSACAAGSSCCANPDGGARCANLSADVTSCGACGTTCPAPANADPACDAGVCGATCRPNFAACDGRTLDGCEVDLLTDPAHCGSCSRACANQPTGAAACTGGNCDLSCNSSFPQHCGLADCRAYDLANCGGCNVACPSGANAGAPTGCSGPGTCTYNCSTNYGDCNGGMDGCETDLTSTPTHCGGCSNNCVAQGWDGGCVNSQCARCYQCPPNGDGSRTTCCGQKCVYLAADQQWECQACAPGSLVDGGC